ncbi:hypothetical protein [Asaia bogorensis]|nr:hypothetical protein [Asaia bogorensis]
MALPLFGTGCYRRDENARLNGSRPRQAEPDMLRATRARHAPPVIQLLP